MQENMAKFVGDRAPYRGRKTDWIGVHINLVARWVRSGLDGQVDEKHS
jgi:hypothetical protein